jgi:hypothetical protein
LTLMKTTIMKIDAEISGHGNRDNGVEEEEEQNAKAKETDTLDAPTEDYDRKNRDAERSGRKKRGRSERRDCSQMHQSSVT